MTWTLNCKSLSLLKIKTFLFIKIGASLLQNLDFDKINHYIATKVSF
jgi:hypothetical protein